MGMNPRWIKECYRSARVVSGSGDVLKVVAGSGGTLTGTRITANEGHPVVMFSANDCATIPSNVQACDRLEEQVPGMRFLGKTFVASRTPVRGVGPDNKTDDVVWQLYAAEDDTTVSISASPGVTGLTFESMVLGRGESVDLLVSGAEQQPGDFYIVSDKPISAMQYMTGLKDPYDSYTGGLGDPAMVYVSPTEQFFQPYGIQTFPGRHLRNHAPLIPVHIATYSRIGQIDTHCPKRRPLQTSRTIPS